MTTIDAAGAPRKKTGRNSRATPLAFMPFLAAMVLSFALAGCESGSSILGGPSGNVPDTQLSQPAPTQSTQTRVAIAPIIGAPDAVAKQLQSDFSAAVDKQKVAIAAPGERADYTLRGYVVAAKEKAQTKVSYIWDVTDPSGKRVNRITGEEIVAGTPSKDAWESVSPQVAQQIAQKSAASFGTWLAQAGGQAAVASAPIGVGAAPPPVQNAIAANTTPTPQTASLRTPPSNPASGSISRSDLIAIVPAVTGAPGDGAQSLTGAIQAELAKNGVPLSSEASNTAYRVEGVVKMGQARDGRQPIQIDWNVKDPAGKKLGTVSQKNEIPEGSLDGSWGKTADAAAAAAAQGILKLLPQRAASN